MIVIVAYIHTWSMYHDNFDHLSIDNNLSCCMTHPHHVSLLQHGTKRFSVQRHLVGWLRGLPSYFAPEDGLQDDLPRFVDRLEAQRCPADCINWDHQTWWNQRWKVGLQLLFAHGWSNLNLICLIIVHCTTIYYIYISSYISIWSHHVLHKGFPPQSDSPHNMDRICASRNL